MSFSLITILVSFALSLAFTGIVLRFLVARAILDVPNERSSHKIPVPRGGGWALLAVIIPALIGASIFFDGDMRHTGLIAAVFLLAGISWMDDKHHINPALRLSLHICAAGLGSLSLAHNATLFGGALPFWFDRTFMIVGWAWFINLYNFMDGIDGITGVETISIATGLCLVMAATGLDNAYIDFLTLVLTGTCLGFLAYNWHPARLFLGDVGSVPLGCLTGFCLLLLATQGHLAAAIILPLYYLADSGITITRRALRREKIWQAHRQHFYQIAAAKAGHPKISLLIAAANVGLTGSAIFSVTHPLFALALAAVIVATLLGKMQKIASQPA